MKIANKEQFAEALAQAALRAWFRTGAADFTDMNTRLNRLATKAVLEQLENIMCDSIEDDANTIKE